MRNLIIRIVVNALALWAAATFVEGVTLSDEVGQVVIVAFVFGLVNAVLKPILKIVSFPFIILTLGLIWGLWHLPAFLLSGTQQSAWSFTPFLAGTMAISVIASVLFHATRGSILLAGVLHFQLMNPIWPDAQPYDTYLLLGIAGLMLWGKRQAMFHRVGAVTGVTS